MFRGLDDQVILILRSNPAHLIDSRVLAWRDRLHKFVDGVAGRICNQELYLDRLDISDMIGIHRRKATELVHFQGGNA